MNAFPSKSLSDNRKSKIKNPKLAGLFAILVAITVCGARAEAQQPGKVPRIKYPRGIPRVIPLEAGPIIPLHVQFSRLPLVLFKLV